MLGCGLLFSSQMALWGQTAAFTLDIIAGSPGVAPIPLVQSSNLWFYHKGTNPPPVGWETMPDASLDANAWTNGQGGFGFGDAGIAGEMTTLTDMLNRYTTLFIRRTFEITGPVDTNWHVQLRVDYDDGFVAYLDGTELRRENTTNGVGSVVAYNATTGGVSHEASCCNAPTHPASVYDLGLVSNRLDVGTHVFALVGINQVSSSSDFHLIPELSLVAPGASTSPTVDGFFRLVQTNRILLTGAITLPGCQRVTVNGEEANVNLAEGRWSREQLLAPGMNHLFVAALGADGSVLASISKDVVCETATTYVGGTLSSNATWTANLGIIRLTNDVVVAPGASLQVGEGVVVLMGQNRSLKAQTNSLVEVNGTEDNPVYFLPADATNRWGEISVLGANASMTLRFAEMVAGQVRVLTNATLLLEDSVVRHLAGGVNVIEAFYGQQLTMRRLHLHHHEQTRLNHTPILIEDSLIENISGDATDFLGAPNSIVIRRTTYRHGVGSNTDAIDMGQDLGLLVDQCLIHDFGDKGVSIADNSHEVIIRNSLIYDCTIGISTYHSSNCVYFNNTIAGCTFGMLLRERTAGQGAGHGFATNNIIWGNTYEIILTNGSTLQVGYCDVQDTNWPGAGNISLDPLFANTAVGNYRLLGGSPALEAGFDGMHMGAPIELVGGMPSAPFNVSAIGLSTNQIRLVWQEDADNEEGFVIARSTNGSTWEVLTGTPANATTHVDSGLEPGCKYYYRIRAANASGNSRWSNRTAAQTAPAAVSETMVGGTLLTSTTWSTNMGRILVRSNLIVPTNVSLTILEGAQVALNTNVSLRAAGGIINILGSESNPVILAREHPASDWGELSVSGTNAALTIRHADISGGGVKFYDNAVGLVEDAFVHHCYSSSAIMGSTRAKAVVVRRSHVSYYHEMLFQFTLMLIEDCLFENATDASSDALDFDAAPAGSIIRRCTFRNGPQSNTDAIDIGSGDGLGSMGVLIEDCVMHDFYDKGVSVGETSLGIVIRNCLMYNLGKGVQVKDVSTATIHNCIIADSAIGLHCFEKIAQTGGGRMTNTYNNILYHDASPIVIETNSFLVVNYSDTFGTNWPGLGNINVDPLFRNPAERDYRLQTNSPCLGTGQSGANMGPVFPVGGVPAVPLNLQVIAFADGNAALTWQDASTNESGFVLEFSTNGVLWLPGAIAPRNATNLLVSGLTGGFYWFRARATNFIGDSFNSELAATGATPDDDDSDGMPNWWEDQFSLDRANPADANADPDQDGASNLQEFRAGTSPRDSASCLKLEATLVGNGTECQLQFTAISNRTYAVEFRSSLTLGTWEKLADVPQSATTRIFNLTNAVEPVTPIKFYRVTLSP